MLARLETEFLAEAAHYCSQDVYVRLIGLLSLQFQITIQLQDSFIGRAFIVILQNGPQRREYPGLPINKCPVAIEGQEAIAREIQHRVIRQCTRAPRPSSVRTSFK